MESTSTLFVELWNLKNGILVSYLFYLFIFYLLFRKFHPKLFRYEHSPNISGIRLRLPFIIKI